MANMQRSVEEHLWKIREVEAELARCKPNTPHYNDTKKNLYRLNKQLKQFRSYEKQM